MDGGISIKNRLVTVACLNNHPDRPDEKLCVLFITPEIKLYVTISNRLVAAACLNNHPDVKHCVLIAICSCMFQHDHNFIIILGLGRMELGLRRFRSYYVHALYLGVC